MFEAGPPTSSWAGARRQQNVQEDTFTDFRAVKLH